jgi:hypothetical protein
MTNTYQSAQPMMAMSGAVDGRMESIERSIIALDGTIGRLNDKVGEMVGGQGGGPVQSSQAAEAPVPLVEPKKRESPNEVSIHQVCGSHYLPLIRNFSSPSLQCSLDAPMPQRQIR